MYYSKVFDVVGELIEFMNDNYIKREDIILVTRNERMWYIIYQEKGNEDEKDNTNSSTIPNHGGCYNCDRKKTGDCGYTGHTKLCRRCEVLPRCSRYPNGFNVSG